VRIYNTLRRMKEEFEPLTPDEVRMYVCGVTVYDLSHIGHARSALVFDVIRRYLTFKGYRVTFVKNYTDVDDKIIRRANEEGVSASEVSERYIAEYRTDMAALGVLPGDVEPKATEHIPQMIRLIEALLRAGTAYVVDGDVYFEVRRFPAYGRLSGKNLEELLAGARVEVDERKRDPRDFALWKSAKPGEPSWNSPWGPGRPGWHIECSAMSMAYLGESFDIHGGGEDLIFPHHECEIAQAEAATGKEFARYWMHNGFVNLGAEKMSKSLGNTLLIRELVRRHDGDAIRLWLLGTHYRNPVEWAEERLGEAARGLARFRRLLAAAGWTGARVVEPPRRGTVGEPPPWSADLLALDGEEPLRTDVAEACRQFEDGMDDDFNTPEARAAMFGLARNLEHALERHGPSAPFVRAVHVLATMGLTLGLFERWQEVSGPPDELRRHIEGLVQERDAARKARDWARSDALRAELVALGVSVEDAPGGTRWTWKGA
jgi:cysteinyl-tRNA synthetase